MRAIVNLKEGPKDKGDMITIQNVIDFFEGSHTFTINATYDGNPYAILIPYHNIRSIEFYGKADS